MRILCIADAHPVDCGNGYSALNPCRLLAGVIDEVSSRYSDLNLFHTRPDLIIDMGDRASIQDHDIGRGYYNGVGATRNLRDIYNRYAPNIPKLYIPGNHDDMVLTRAQQSMVTQTSVETTRLDYANLDISVIAWMPTVYNSNRQDGIVVTKDELFDLRLKLQGAPSSDVFIFSHMPLDHGINEISGANVYRMFYKNQSDIARIFAESGKRVRTFSGHLHRTRWLLDARDASAFTMPSLTMVNKRFHSPEARYRGPRKKGAYTVIDINDTAFSVSVHSLKQMNSFRKQYDRAHHPRWAYER